MIQILFILTQFNFEEGKLVNDKGFSCGTVEIYISMCWYMASAMAPHSSTLAWKFPWMEEPGGLQSMGLLRVGHNWVTSLSLFTLMHWKRKWQPTPVFLPGESQGRESLVVYCLWGRTESDTTEATQQQQQQQQQNGIFQSSYICGTVKPILQSVFPRHELLWTVGNTHSHSTSSGYFWRVFLNSVLSMALWEPPLSSPG